MSTEQKNGQIENMRVLCALLVVWSHCAHVTRAPAGSAWWWFTYLFFEGVCRIAVPFFFITAGWFVAKHIGESDWWKKETLKRVRSLAVPFFLWNLIAFAVLPPMPKATVWTVLGLDPFKFPYLIPYWFVRTLFLLVLATPLVRYCVTGRRAIAWFGLLYAAMLLQPHPHWTAGTGWYFFDAFLPPMALLCYGLGVRLRIAPPSADTLGKLRRLALPCLVLGLAFFVAYCLQWMRTPYCTRTLQALGVPLALYGTWALMPQRALAAAAARFAFPVYTLHCIVLILLRKPLAGCSEPCAFLVKIATAIAASALVTWILRRTLPKSVYPFAFGGR